MTKKTLIILSLAAFWILLASAEIFSAAGRPEAFFRGADLSLLLAADPAFAQKTLLIYFLRQIHLPVILGLSVFWLAPRYGISDLFKGVFTLFLAIQAFWIWTSGVGFPFFQVLYSGVIVALLPALWSRVRAARRGAITEEV